MQTLAFQVTKVAVIVYYGIPEVISIKILPFCVGVGGGGGANSQCHKVILVMIYPVKMLCESVDCYSYYLAKEKNNYQLNIFCILL